LRRHAKSLFFVVGFYGLIFIGTQETKENKNKTIPPFPYFVRYAEGMKPRDEKGKIK
jgi:hypothetical protein